MQVIREHTITYYHSQSDSNEYLDTNFIWNNPSVRTTAGGKFAWIPDLKLSKTYPADWYKGPYLGVPAP